MSTIANRSLKGTNDTSETMKPEVGSILEVIAHSATRRMKFDCIQHFLFATESDKSISSMSKKTLDEFEDVFNRGMDIVEYLYGDVEKDQRISLKIMFYEYLLRKYRKYPFCR